MEGTPSIGGVPEKATIKNSFCAFKGIEYSNDLEPPPGAARANRFSTDHAPFLGSFSDQPQHIFTFSGRFTASAQVFPNQF